ncbi:MAG: type II toxin-antitoxin system VapB family antitoxin [Synechococcaceae cyanobacterium]|nr:type II toxin-antitoxin system VapB family antitoxin [Synechococcaceae cyanobacterium]
MAVNIKSARVDELLGQLRQLTGRGATEIVRDALEQELRRQRQLRRVARLGRELEGLQDDAAAHARAFDPDALYGANGLPG